MSEKYDITHLFTFKDKTELERNDGFYTIEKCTTTASCEQRVKLQSFVIITEGYYYRDYKDLDGNTIVERKGDAGLVEVHLIFDDETKRVCSRFFANGSSDAPLIEAHEIVFNISEEDKHKKIKKVLLLYNYWYSERGESSSIEKHLKITNIKAYGFVDDFDTGIRIKGANGRIYKILGTSEQSSVRVKTPVGIKNIKTIPLTEAQNTQLRIKTKQGVMAVAIK